MRRSLAGIVPEEILNRRRKAFVVRAPIMAISTQWSSLTELTRDMISSSLGIINSASLREALEGLRRGRDLPLVPALRAISLERWLRHAMKSDRIDLTAVLAARSDAGNHLLPITGLPSEVQR
jgi:asparagine synthase (glutamine-hydrolysing)